MKTEVFQSQVCFATIASTGHKFALARTTATGKEIRLYWPDFQHIIACPDGRLSFERHNNRKVNRGDKVVYVTGQGGEWPWGSEEDYKKARDFGLFSKEGENGTEPIKQPYPLVAAKNLVDGVTTRLDIEISEFQSPLTQTQKFYQRFGRQAEA